jgi:hypothetical protein
VDGLVNAMGAAVFEKHCGGLPMHALLGQWVGWNAAEERGGVGGCFGWACCVLELGSPPAVAGGLYLSV